MFVPPEVVVQATFRWTVTGPFQPGAKWRRRGLEKPLMISKIAIAVTAGLVAALPIGRWRFAPGPFERIWQRITYAPRPEAVFDRRCGADRPGGCRGHDPGLD